MRRMLKCVRLVNTFLNRRMSNACQINQKKGLVLGIYDGCCPGEFKLTSTAAKFDDCMGGKFSDLLRGTKISRGIVQVFGNLGDEFYLVAAAGLGPESAAFNEVEALDECKENIRVAAGAGARALQDQGISQIFVEEFTNAEAAAEGAILGVWKYQDWKATEDQDTVSSVDLYTGNDRDGWTRGIVKAEAQNMAREIEEVPGNLMTPTIFARFVQEHLCPCGVHVEVRDREWMETNNFNALLTMAKGSCEVPVLIELKYCGAGQRERPIGLTGKGTTFDTGGLCLKECLNMSKNRGDLAGAAVIVGVFRAAARMNLPINLTAVLSIYENMPSGMAAKPGDVVIARNGKTIRIDNTDHDGRVVAADSLSYLENYQPCLVLNVATAATGLLSSLGNPPNGIFSTSDVLWEELNRAGSTTGDRVWRLPFWKFFRSRVTNNAGVDTTNVGRGPGGWPCLNAAFLLEFAPPCIDFVHVDISGTGIYSNNPATPYLRKNTMSGRPTRMLVNFLYQIACPHDNVNDC